MNPREGKLKKGVSKETDTPHLNGLLITNGFERRLQLQGRSSAERDTPKRMSDVKSDPLGRKRMESQENALVDRVHQYK